MLDLQSQPERTAPDAAHLKGSAWAVARRLFGYIWAYKLRLGCSVLFAVGVAASLSSMVIMVAGAVDLLYASDDDIEAKVEGIVERVGPAMEVKPVAFALTHGAGWEPDKFDAHARAFFLNLRQERGRALAYLSAGLVFVAIVGGIARFLQEYFAGSVGASISVQLCEEMFENIMNMSVLFFEKRSTGEILARFTNDVFMVYRGLANVFVKLMREPIKAVFFLCIALSVDWFLTLIVVVILPLIGFVMVRIGKKVKKSVRRSLEKIASMASVATETVKGIAIVKAYCMENYEIERVNRELSKLRRYLLKTLKADAAVGPIIELLMILGFVVLALMANRAVEQGTLSEGGLVSLVGAIAMMVDPVRKLSAVNNLIQTSVASAERVFEFIDVKPDIIEASGAVVLPPLKEALRFENVHFSYDGKADVLQGIDFEVKKGEMIALVGFSGAGKSTIVKLIPRFYDPTAGAVLVDGVDIRQATFHSLRDQISIVTQDTILFDEAIRDNIAFGRSQYSDERVREAAQAAQASDFIEQLPKKYDTRIGEAGGTLSGGQRQRLAIARAIIKDPSILILDEATSSLDSESERAIQKAIDEFVVGRTTLVIAHRLSTVQRADRILVIHEGRIAEQGTHQQLLAQNGLYRRLHETQFGNAPVEQADAS